MSSPILSGILTALFSFVSWLTILTSFSFLKDAPRAWFVAIHYTLNIAVFSLFFGIHFKFFPSFSPFATMATAMTSLIVFEAIYWGYFYKGELWFLNFTDWILPAFLIASTIYFVGVFIK